MGSYTLQGSWQILLRWSAYWYWTIFLQRSE